MSMYYPENKIVKSKLKLLMGVLCIIAFFTMVFVQPAFSLNQSDVGDAANMVFDNAERQAQLITGINDYDIVTGFIILIMAITIIAAWLKFSALIMPIAILILILFVLNWRGYF